MGTSWTAAPSPLDPAADRNYAVESTTRRWRSNRDGQTTRLATPVYARREVNRTHVQMREQPR
jgi:hypothetical protein